MLSQRSSIASNYQDKNLGRTRATSVRGSINQIPRVQIFLDTQLNKAIKKIKDQKKPYKLLDQSINVNRSINTNKNQEQQSNKNNQIILIPNDLVMKYIKEIYIKYGIKDPLSDQDGFDFKNKFIKSMNIHNSNPSTKNYQTQKKEKRVSSSHSKIAQLKSKYKNQTQSNTNEQTTIKKINTDLRFQYQHKNFIEQQTQDFLNTSAYTHILQSKQMSSHNKITCFDEQNYQTLRPKKRLFVKTKLKSSEIKNTNQIFQSTYKFQQLPEQNISYQKQKIYQSKIIYPIKQTQNKQVKMIYRYCLMCQQCIIQQNILSHQKKCKSLQNAYLMSLPQLLNIVEQKIIRMKKQIIQSNFFNLKKQNIKQTKQKVQNWLDMTKKWQQKNVSFDYSSYCFKQVQNCLKKYYLESCQTINKLNWFLKLKKSFLQKSQ